MPLYQAMYSTVARRAVARGGPGPGVDELALVGGEEALGEGVVPAWPLAAADSATWAARRLPATCSPITYDGRVNRADSPDAKADILCARVPAGWATAWLRLIQLTAGRSEGRVRLATGTMHAMPDRLTAEGHLVREEIVNGGYCTPTS